VKTLDNVELGRIWFAREIEHFETIDTIHLSSKQQNHKEKKNFELHDLK
jgi:hypothetical protein